MTIDQVPASDPDAVQAELTPPAAPRPGTPTALEQVIEHMRASYLMDLRVLEAKLRQRAPATDREPLEVLPSARAQPQTMRPAQGEHARADVPGAETPIPHPPEAPPAPSAPAQPSWIPHFPEPLRLGAKGWVLLMVRTIFGSKRG
jgi:hypothetical protein